MPKFNFGDLAKNKTYSKEGNQTGIMSIPQAQTLYRKNIISLDFQIQVPRVLKPGVYKQEIIIAGGGITKIIPINITITDSILPTIDSIDGCTPSMLHVGIESSSSEGNIQ